MPLKLHPREEIVTEAEIWLREKLAELKKKFELTEGEYFKIISYGISSEWVNITKYWIRQERHGDTNKPGGLE